MEQMKTFKRFLEEHPNFWTDVDVSEPLSFKRPDGTIIWEDGQIKSALTQYYYFYYVNRDYDEMVHYFRLQSQKFIRDGFEKLFVVYDDIKVQDLLFDFLRESDTGGKDWTRNRPINLISDEDSASSVSGFSNQLVDKGYSKNQVSQFMKLVDDFRNIYKKYINSFGYIFCEVF